MPVALHAWDPYKYKTDEPKSGYSYDYQSGNSYNYNTDSRGETKVYGNNYNTGSMWNTTIEKDGDMKGFDSKGNYWNYDNKSGTYYNFGTGEIKNSKYNW